MINMLRKIYFIFVTVMLLIFSSSGYADQKIIPLHIKCNEKSPGRWYAFPGESKTYYILKTIGMEERSGCALSENLPKSTGENRDLTIVDDLSMLKPVKTTITDWPGYLKKKNVKKKKKLKVTALCGTQESHTEKGSIVNMEDQSKLDKVGVFYCKEGETLSIKFEEPLCSEIETSNIYYYGELTIYTLKGQEEIDIEEYVKKHYVVVGTHPLEYDSDFTGYDCEEYPFFNSNSSTNRRSRLCSCCKKKGGKYKKYRKKRCSCCKNCCSIL